MLFNIKAGTQTDTKVRLRGKGVPSLRNKSVRGDHYVTLVVQIPEKLTQSQKEALLAFNDEMEGNTKKIKPESEKEDSKETETKADKKKNKKKKSIKDIFS